MTEKIIPYLSDFCAEGSSKGPLLNQKVDIEMHKKRVGGEGEIWGTDGLELVGFRGCLSKWRPHGLTFLWKKGEH